MPIPGATAATYIPVSSDVGHTLTSTVVATGSPGAKSSATSAATVPIVAASSPSSPVTAGGSVTPGPNLALYNQDGTASSPYYTCSTNFYVTASASGSGTGSSGSPWTFAQAVASSAPTAGACINVAAGSYSITGVTITHGGTNASTTGYVAWRCQTMPFSFSGGVIQGEHNGCWLREPSGTGYNEMIEFGASYVIFDGFELDSTNDQNTVAGFDNELGGSLGSRTNATKYDHIILLNNDVHGFGQSGIQWYNQDWVWVIHNIWHDNAGGPNNGSAGSGFSDYDPVTRTGYVPTKQDQLWYSNTTSTQYHVVLAYNVAYRNYNNYSTSTTDGEGIILDDWGHTQNTCNGVNGTCPYTGAALVMGNIVYYNGGNGIEAFSWASASQTASVTAVNNTIFDNEETIGHNAANWGANALLNNAYHQTWFNNIMYSVAGTNRCWGPSTASGNSTCGILDGSTSGTTGNTWHNNIAYNSGTGPAISFVSTTDTYPTTGTNYNLSGTNPELTSVTARTVGNNFALQPGSPAIGFGKSFDLWQQSGSVDVGACVSTVTTCP